MAYTILVHMLNEDAIVGEIEELPEQNSPFIMITSPRLRDGRDVSYFLPETHTILLPWNRIHSIEILPTEGEEKIVTFVRE
ncbi:MAG TPA: hypothetical protein PLJ78_05710 [Anaerolineae bacterium]|nr:hypothetical protein [Anaerolineae bacterium]HQI86687.1 hypothetical protein [Anaerolineae bacterium]HQK13423.1 hypothetical protein [Anaerolineae bacterium]